GIRDDLVMEFRRVLFRSAVLNGFAPLCEKYQMTERSNRYGRHMEKLRKGIEQAWDGDWYRRAYFDDGTPLGSAQNDECRIDSIEIGRESCREREEMQVVS